MATLSARLQAEIDRSNAVTEITDTTVHNAITTLIAGYGQGGEDLTIGSTIVVTSKEGAVVTCTRGSKTYAGTVGSERTVTFTVKSTGVWNLTATIDTEEEAVTDTVVVEEDNTTYGASLSWRLPSAYQEVEYLQSVVGSYVNTGISPTEKTAISIEFCTVNEITNDTHFFGSRVSATSKAFNLLYINPNGYNYIRFLHGSSSNEVSTTLVTPSTLINKHLYYCNGTTVKVDNTTIMSFSTDAFTGELPIWLFGCNNGGTLHAQQVSEKVYSAKLYNDTELVRDFIPCYRKSDSVAGLWDTVSKTFFTNDGTGTFVVGGDVA